MTKNIVLDDGVYSELFRLKELFGVSSVSEVIRILLD